MKSLQTLSLVNKNVILKGNISLPIDNIQYDSRLVTKRSLFCAIKGTTNDGHNFIADAINKGATAILCSHEYQCSDSDLQQAGFLMVPPSNIRKTLAEISSIYYDYPTDEMKLIGVTGTDGKSTTIFFIHQLLTQLHIKNGYHSTVNSYDGTNYKNNDTRQSTPESPQIHKALFNMHKNNCKIAILETTSHGLSEKTRRTDQLLFDIGVLTNIGSEHLDFHKTHEQYVEDKSILFQKIRGGGIGIIDSNSPYFSKFREKIRYLGGQIRTYSLTQSAHYTVTDIQFFQRHIEGMLNFHGLRTMPSESQSIFFNCLGVFNLENLLTAVAAIHQLHIPFKDIIQCVPKLTPPKGRLQIVRNDLSILPIIDYAHTPRSFSQLLPMIKSMTKKKLIVVFGSAGDRDTHKREIQGSIADKYADIIVLTNEDPRHEDPIAIINQISEGCKKHKLNKNLFHIPSRSEAIMHALSMAKEGDTVLFLGKGHENSIVEADTSIPWNEEKEVQQAIEYLLPSKIKW